MVIDRMVKALRNRVEADRETYEKSFRGLAEVSLRGPQQRQDGSLCPRLIRYFGAALLAEGADFLP
jgi:hypothetical protein